MPGNSRHAILRDDAEVGALYALPWHGRTCLHTGDAALVETLLAGGLVVPSRPPFLDAAEGGVHGAYRPRPQINLFFEVPLDKVVSAIRPTLEENGYALAPSGAAAG